jgi:integrase
MERGDRIVTGNITRRGAHSWRLKYEAAERDPATGRRNTRTLTIRGTKKTAQGELTRLLAEVDRGISVDPSKVTVAEYLRAWLDGADGLSPKTAERYRQLAEQQVIPHLGVTALQKLRPAQVEAWHGILLKSGGKDGRPLSARTVGHAHRVLHRALARAAKSEIVSRNVASVISPPRVDAAEIRILAPDQIGELLRRLEWHPLHALAVVAIGTGMRRGELCALAWGAIDLDAAAIRVERSTEETATGTRMKAPKTRHGRRLICLPANVVTALRSHRVQQLERRFALGAGALKDDDLAFTTPTGLPLSPDNLSRDWARAVRARKLPATTFHALRHLHASALIACGIDVLTISRRLGHASPTITLAVYGHMFSNTDAKAAEAIEAAMTG